MQLDYLLGIILFVFYMVPLLVYFLNDTRIKLPINGINSLTMRALLKELSIRLLKNLKKIGRHLEYIPRAILPNLGLLFLNINLLDKRIFPLLNILNIDLGQLANIFLSKQLNTQWIKIILFLFGS